MHEKAIKELIDKQSIADVIKLYARALDRLDESLLRSVFHPGSTHNHFYQGPSSEPGRPGDKDDPGDFVRFAIKVLSANRYTHHQLGNILIEFEGEGFARAETYFTAYHRMRAQGDPLAPDNAMETEMDYFVAGRYLDRFELRSGAWKIVERTGMTDWVRLEAPCSAGMAGIDPGTIGARAPDDFLYKLANSAPIQAGPI